MCYILYGAVNPEIDKTEYEQINSSSEFSFCIGTKHDVKMCIQNETCDFRVTDWICDCEFPVGAHQPLAEELKELERIITDFSHAKNSKYIYLCKTWQGRRNKTEQTVNINDISIPQFLADANVNCLYKIILLDKEGR